MKKTEILASEKDYSELIKLICSYGLIVFTPDNTQVFGLSNTSSVYYAFSSNVANLNSKPFINAQLREVSDYIYVERSSELIQGAIALFGTADSVLGEAFKRLIDYIKKEYILTYNKIIYIGPDLYSTWLLKKVSFPFIIIQAKYFDAYIDAQEIEDLFSFINKKNMNACRVEEDIRVPNALIEIDDSFLIYMQGAHLSMWSKNARDRKKYYTMESEAIFVYTKFDRKRKKYRYRFTVDIRNWGTNGDSSVADGFYALYYFFNEESIEVIAKF